MGDIFLSYSREDKVIMQHVRQRLQAAGLSVWTDDKLAPGTPSWVIAIENALDNAGCMVVLFSPSSKKSEWVIEELNYARTHNLTIFPILAAGSEQTAVPFGFSRTQWVDIRFDPEQELARLIAAIQEEMEVAETEQDPDYKTFWASLLKRSKDKTDLFLNVSPRDYHQMRTGAGRAGLSFRYVISRTRITVDFYIDVKDKAKNKALFESLFQQKSAIEETFDAELEWQRLDYDQASLIRKTVGYRQHYENKEKWAVLQEQMIETMIRLEHTLAPYILQMGLTPQNPEELTEREKRYVDFWSALTKRSRGKTPLFANIAPSTGNWIAASAGKTGHHFGYVFTRSSVQIELYIDMGDQNRNKAIFDTLYSDAAAIEMEFGAPLDWQRLDQRRACRICYVVGERGALNRPEDWPVLQDQLIEAMIRLDQAFRQRIIHLQV